MKNHLRTCKKRRRSTTTETSQHPQKKLKQKNDSARNINNWEHVNSFSMTFKSDGKAKVLIDNIDHMKPFQIFTLLMTTKMKKFDLKDKSFPDDFEECIVVDETLILFKGRWKARQHVRGKPHATGCKLFTLADSDGCMYDFWLYCGKGSAHNRSNNTVGYVYDLLENLPDRDTRKYCVIADQFYGSEDLALELYDAGYDMILCYQKNRPTYLSFNESDYQLFPSLRSLSASCCLLSCLI